MFLVPATAAELSEEEQIQATIEQYYELGYDSWWGLRLKDFSSVLDMNSVQMNNFLTAMEENIFKWNYIIEHGYYSGQRERHEIFFDYESINISSDRQHAEVSVNLTGEEEGMPAYPAFVTLDENQFLLTKEDGIWKITSHAYNDCSLFEKSIDQIIIFDEEAVILELEADYEICMTPESMYTSNEINEPNAAPYTDYSYSSSRAVKYAKKFVQTPNSHFYNTSSDCTNFVSQCVSYGFGNTTDYSLNTSYRMVTTGNTSTGWSAGTGGGYLAWENVGKHWKYMRKAKTGLAGPRVNKTTYANLVNGDVMQVDFTSDGTYDHSAICVDRANQKFAQHSFNGYRYYSDYTGTKRYYHPKFFREY